MPETAHKKSERLRRSEVRPIDVANLTLESAMSVQLESFWAKPRNNYEFDTWAEQNRRDNPIHLIAKRFGNVKKIAFLKVHIFIK